jgi:hypothetical protein
LDNIGFRDITAGLLSLVIDLLLKGLFLAEKFIDLRNQLHSSTVPQFHSLIQGIGDFVMTWVQGLWNRGTGVDPIILNAFALNQLSGGLLFI